MLLEGVDVDCVLEVVDVLLVEDVAVLLFIAVYTSWMCLTVSAHPISRSWGGKGSVK